MRGRGEDVAWWRRNGARLRLVISIVAVLVLGTALVVVAARALLYAQLEDRTLSQLHAEVAEINLLFDEDDDGAEGRFALGPGDGLHELFDTFLAVDPPETGEWILTLVEGEVHASVGAGQMGHDLATDRAFVERIAAVDTRVSGSLNLPSGQVRYVVEPVTLKGESGHFVAAAHLAEEQAEIGSVTRTLIAMSLVLILAGSVVAFVVAGRVFAPMRRLTATARRISETDLSRRIAVSGADEFAELGHTFNEMLDRLDTAFAAQHRLLRDVGHELRTPLAIASGHLEFVAETEENRESLVIVRDEHRRMSRLIDDLLTLARAERRGFLLLETVDLADLIQELLSKARRLGDREWLADYAEAGKVVADRQRLTQAMVVLLDNAVRYTSPGDQILLGARCTAGTAVLWVGDSGPGVPEEERERIFAPFKRGRDVGPGTGTGLGLAIAKTIAETRGGGIGVGSSPSGGACFTITLPVDQPDIPEE
ncbi:MAG TPA: HAMP domain-containing sensor histidine kinase [Arachnia sp.]|nr:HAMP domain-containing sensor histidine kinase [Arachnia sp.]HMT84991.1 HAMP domain-containing sensor histidine kinase [Arachnia sp.]